jgi:multidrug transporter EmrE-like cation transporter
MIRENRNLALGALARLREIALTTSASAYDSSQRWLPTIVVVVVVVARHQCMTWQVRQNHMTIDSNRRAFDTGIALDHSLLQL